MDLGTEARQIDDRKSGSRYRAGRPLAAALLAGVVVAIGLGVTVSRGGEAALETASGPLKISGDSVWRWDDPAGEVYLLEGRCRVERGGAVVEGDRVLVLLTRTQQPQQGPGDGAFRVALRIRRGRTTASPTLLVVDQRPDIAAPWYRGRPTRIPSDLEPLRVAVGAAERSPEGAASDVRLAQFEQIPPGPGAPSGPLAPGVAPPFAGAPPAAGAPADASPLEQNGMQFLLGGGSRSIEFAPRSASTPAQLQLLPVIGTGESVVVIRGGGTVLVRDVQASMGDGSTFDLGTITLSADRIVSWLPAMSGIVSGDSSLSQSEGEIYLEGDIVFRQGDRVIYADRMYYNVTREYGMILAAEAITSIPEYEGYVRLKADVLQQVAKGEFIGFGAAVTTSRLGVPRYWLQSEQVQFSQQDVPRVDPLTGQSYVASTQSVSSTDNTIYVGGFPVFYWPVFASDLERPTFYLTGLKVRNDDIFGAQVLADFDVFQLFGVQTPPEDVDWTLSTDYLSERGPAVGTKLTYALPGLFGTPGPVTGFLDAWVIHDNGLDTLGSDRRLLEPEEEIRGRLLFRHRHYLPDDYELIAEAGWLSDRNFLEQYLEDEWDADKDHDTQIRLRKYHFNQLFDLHAKAHINDFYTDTARAPQLDHYLLGGSFFTDRLNWSVHNRVGYAALEVAEPPENPAEQAKFTTLPGEADREGIVASTRQELSAPLLLGALKVVPFVSGEVAHWGEDIQGEEVTRLLGQTGVRGSIPAWRLYPGVESSLLNIRGLAHKVELQGEFFYADSSENIDQIPLYDPLDDNAQEQFRRRFVFNTFGGALPPQFDPRLYAYRQGMQRLVTAPSQVIADDLVQTRLGLHQRLQTKRGLPGRERIVDLIRFDVDTILFHNDEEANFGETIGPTTYDFRYFLGDRVTLLSDGYFDFFEDGLRSVSAGVLSSRPGLGDVYLGLLSLQGPIDSTVLRGNIDYRLNEKWIVSAGTTFDLGEIGNVGQQLALTRIGESALLRMGIVVDEGRDNVGFQIMVEPRFWPGRRLGELGGQLIPPPGLEGLE